MTLRKKPTYTFIDLFAGMGGFHVAFNETGRARCVFASEWDPAARKTYKHHFNSKSASESDRELFKNNDQYFGGDITKPDVQEKIPRTFDILCGGFPCQPFSQAGRKLGFKDTRGTLFYEIAKILDEHEPDAIFLENVRGLLTHNNGHTFRTIRRVLKGFGYHGEAKLPIFAEVVKASEYGLPQHRPRLFMVGFKSKKAAAYFAKNRPKKVPLRYTMSDIMKGRVTYYGSDREREIGFTLRCGGRGSGVRDRRNWDWYVVNGKEKPITFKEGLLMQGFVTRGKDGRRYSFPKSVPMTQRMKQLGNSVAVDAIKAWADAIIAALDNG